MFGSFLGVDEHLTWSIMEDGPLDAKACMLKNIYHATILHKLAVQGYIVTF